MLCEATQEGRVLVEKYDRMWFTGEGIPGLGRFPEEGKVFWPGEFYGLDIVHGVTKSQT